jgi:hypothetical protein
MKVLALAAAAALSFTVITSPVGKQFSLLKAETLKDQVVTLPDAVKGKSSIICLAYSQKAEKDLKTWYEPTYNKFIAKTGLLDDVYDIHLYFIPMFTGANAAAAGSAKKQIEKDVQVDLHPHILVYRGDVDAYKASLSMDEKEKPYIYVLDAAGKVVYMTSGAFTEEKMDEIEDKLE